MPACRLTREEAEGFMRRQLFGDLDGEAKRLAGERSGYKRIAGLIATHADDPDNALLPGFERCGVQGRSVTVGDLRNALDDPRVVFGRESLRQHFCAAGQRHYGRCEIMELLDAIYGPSDGYRDPVPATRCTAVASVVAPGNRWGPEEVYHRCAVMDLSHKRHACGVSGCNFEWPLGDGFEGRNASTLPLHGSVIAMDESGESGVPA